MRAPYRTARNGEFKRNGVVALGEEISEEVSKEIIYAPATGERIAKVEEREKNNTRRISRLEVLAEAINSQNENIARLVVQLEAANKRLECQDARLCAIEKQPADRVEAVIRAVITALAGAIAGALIGMII